MCGIYMSNPFTIPLTLSFHAQTLLIQPKPLVNGLTLSDLCSRTIYYYGSRAPTVGSNRNHSSFVRRLSLNDD